jgi:UDP-N-acetylglucosamine 2-epimerase (non-hydrolysing)
MKIISVVGARPNFVKFAPFIRAVEKYNSGTSGVRLSHLLVHSGQHYSENMSGKFFGDLDIPEPEINLEIGSGTHAEQVGMTMIAFEKVLREHKPDWVIVFGDVNATLACSVTAKKEWTKCCHIEAGLRSGDFTMPEEINRVVTDRISDLLFTPDKFATENLLREGIHPDKIHFVGNIMIDTLDEKRSKASLLVPSIFLKETLLKDKYLSDITFEKYAVVTLHRPSNVDNHKSLNELISFISGTVANDLTVIWPVHPRTYQNLNQLGELEKIEKNPRIVLTHPLGYLEMLRLNIEAKILITDSGGLQEECTVLGTPCLTLRSNTERPATLRLHGGVSILAGNRIESIKAAYKELMLMKRSPFRPELWDGKTADRIVEVLAGINI